MSSLHPHHKQILISHTIRSANETNSTDILKELQSLEGHESWIETGSGHLLKTGYDFLSTPRGATGERGGFIHSVDKAQM